jgi:hypothetical protein
MKEFEIWSEGHAASGEHSSAYFYGKSKGDTFDDACVNFRHKEDIICEHTGELTIKKGTGLALDVNSDGLYSRANYAGDKINGKEKINKIGNYKIWACQLFDNEIDARKTFG